MKKFINIIVLVYILACIVDLCAPIMGPRGSDWNLIATALKWLVA